MGIPKGRSQVGACLDEAFVKSVDCFQSGGIGKGKRVRACSDNVAVLLVEGSEGSLGSLPVYVDKSPPIGQ